MQQQISPIPALGRTIPISILLFAALLYFLLRGPYRAVKEFGDFRTPYAATRAWIFGGNPYDIDSLAKVWAAGGNNASDRPGLGGSPSVYPPTAFVILIPFAVFPWRIGKAIWLLVHLISLALILVSLGKKVSKPSKPFFDFRHSMLLFLLLVLCFAPLQTAIALGNSTLSVLMLIVAGFYAVNRRKQIIGGVCFGLATGLKPHLMGGVLVFYLITNRRVFSAAVGVVILMTLIGCIRLQLTHPGWLTDLRNNIAGTTQEGGVNDPSPKSDASNTLISLNVTLLRLIKNKPLVNAIVATVTAFLAVLLTLAYRRGGPFDYELLALGAAIAISLIPTYHRNYDAVFLLIGSAWAILFSGERQKVLAILIVASMLFFLLPGGKLLTIAAQKRHLTAAITSTWWWSIIYTHPSLATLFCAIFMVLAVSQFRKTSFSPSLAR